MSCICQNTVLDRTFLNITMNLMHGGHDNVHNRFFLGKGKSFWPLHLRIINVSVYAAYITDHNNT